MTALEAHGLDLECELGQYVATALWCSSDEAYNVGEDMPADTSLESAGFTLEDLAPEALASMREDLAAFIHHADPRALAFWEAELGAGQVGHDFWLTRNGHGAGFWDRFGAGVGRSFGNHLTEAAKAYGSSDLYVGDDGLIHAS